MHSPLQSHMKAALRVLRYLKGSHGLGIQFDRVSNLKLEVFSNADWAKCPKTKKIVTGYYVFFGKSLVSWKRKKQATLSKSSTEVEYRSMASATCEIIWLGNLLHSLGKKTSNGSVPNPLFVKDYRPISLIGIQYKIIAKILANRLSKVIDSIISQEQLAFISCRQILDGPLILSKIIDWYKKQNKKLLLFKVDFEKAFDSDHKDMENIIRVLHVFYMASGLKININKSNLFGVGVSSEEVANMAANSGGLGIYFMSIFKAPNMVIKVSKSLRALFFWGSTEDNKNIAWVKWSNILASFNKRGLGVGDGSLIRFGIDTWGGDLPLRDRFNRSFSDFVHMLDIIGSVEVRKDIESCFWYFSNDGNFSVSSICHHIDDHLLPSMASSTMWCKFIPMKVNIFMWRLSLDRLPHRFNLSSRGELEYDPKIEKTAKRLIHLLPTFHGLAGEDPHKHLKEFHVVCSTMKPREVTEEQIKLHAFPFSLVDKAKDWLYYLPSGKTYVEFVNSIEKRYTSIGRGLLTMDRNMIDAASGGALVHKMHTEARTLISNMAANSQQFGTRQECPTKSVSEVKTSYDQRLDNLTSLVEKLVMGNSTQQVKSYGICSVVGHPTDMCLTLQDGIPKQMNKVGGFPGPPQRKYDPFSSTYNPRWRDHPNFSYRSRSNSFQQQYPKPTTHSHPSFLNSSMSLEDIVKKLATSTQQYKQDTKSTIQHLENQIGQLATSVNQLKSQASGKLPSQTVNNPKQKVSAITLQSVKVLEEKTHKPSKRDLEKEIVKEGSTSQTNQLQEMTRPLDEIKIPPLFPGCFAKSRKQVQEKEILTTFYKVEVNIPPLDAIKQVPRYAKFLKELCTSKRKLKGNEKVLLGENVSAMIQKKLPIKCKDPGRPFLKTARTNICVHEVTLTMEFDGQVIMFNIYNSMKYPGNEHFVFSIDVIDSLVQKVFKLNDEDSLKVALTNTISQSENKELEPNSNLQEAISRLNSLAPVNKIVSYLGLPLNNAKLLPSIVQAPKLELKKLPDHLKYLFLGEGDILPVISSNKLTPVEDERLIRILRDYKEVIGWTVADISGISPFTCMHKILLEERATPSKQVQRRLNPPIMEVVKKEIQKLLDA
ncbi:DNA-directed DNA polymerase, partial [Tanacetum coccineum]